MERLKTDRQLQKRLAVGVLIFFLAAILSNLAIGFVAAIALTGWSIHQDNQAKLKQEEDAKLAALEKQKEEQQRLEQKKAKALEKRKKAKKSKSVPIPGGGGGKGKGNSNINIDHPNFVGAVKGHSHPVTEVCISDDAKLLATASKDAVRVFDAPGLLATPATYSYHRIPVEGDLASALTISNCGAYVVFAGSTTRNVHIWEVQPFSKNRKPEEMMVVPTDHKTSVDFVKFVTAGVRPYLVTASSSKEDTSIRLYTKKGKQLAKVDTRKAQINGISTSADGQFIAVANWTSEVVVFEVCRDKEHIFQKLAPAMVFKGHKSKVLDVRYGAFPNGYHRAVSASAAGEVHVWNTDVNYKLKQDVRLAVQLEKLEAVSLIAVDNAMRVVAALSPSTLRLYKLDAGATGGEVLLNIPMPQDTAKPLQLFFLPSLPYVGTLFEGSKHCLIWQVPNLPTS